ncbi:PEPxxWA-CTERM sorting domain-containing protein [Novosphingopyxis baekryungensis]|uniref:PEPxxWA-CTERM sorting domain-containing protein n=1 Tax=Novosphingopyxis baekryungensis TaxID=279369 RepID=UPI000408AE16|nr:PEPxxWA-CTERM sorting domain-containing protein [Novosphingopyxis baekryungensis]
MTSLVKKTAAMGAAALMFAVPSAANAAEFVIDVNNVPSVDGLFEPGNALFSYDIGAGAQVTNVAWNLSLTTFGLSWLSEAQLGLYSTALDGVILTWGPGDDFAGSSSYAGSLDLVGEGLDFFAGSDGLVFAEFFEDFDDDPGFADAIYTGGTVTVTYEPAIAGAVPEPATWALMLLGFGFVGGAMRQRKRQNVSVSYA